MATRTPERWLVPETGTTTNRVGGAAEVPPSGAQPKWPTGPPCASPLCPGRRRAEWTAAPRQSSTRRPATLTRRRGAHRTTAALGGNLPSSFLALSVHSTHPASTGLPSPFSTSYSTALHPSALLSAAAHGLHHGPVFSAALLSVECRPHRLLPRGELLHVPLLLPRHPRALHPPPSAQRAGPPLPLVQADHRRSTVPPPLQRHLRPPAVGRRQPRQVRAQPSFHAGPVQPRQPGRPRLRARRVEDAVPALQQSRPTAPHAPPLKALQAAR